MATCIYCRRDFDQHRGDGDHVLPRALGEFEGALIFRGCCPNCNNKIGVFEEELLRLGPEAVFRQLTKIQSKRNRKSGSAGMPGSKGLRAPIVTGGLDSPDYLLDPRDGDYVDQLVIRVKTGELIHVRYWPGMNSNKLVETALAQIGNQKIESARIIYRESEAKDILTKAIDDLIPGDKAEDFSVFGDSNTKHVLNISVIVTENFFRAIAKIAFHYYLVANKRSLNGHEYFFDKIKNYIIGDCGSYKDFFTFQEGEPPGTGGSDSHGKAMDYGHLLSIDETGQHLVAIVSFFFGPEHQGTQYHVEIGTSPSNLVLACGVSGHFYLLNTKSDSKVLPRVVQATPIAKP